MNKFLIVYTLIYPCITLAYSLFGICQGQSPAQSRGTRKITAYRAGVRPTPCSPQGEAMCYCSCIYENYAGECIKPRFAICPQEDEELREAQLAARDREYELRFELSRDFSSQSLQLQKLHN